MKSKKHRRASARGQSIPASLQVILQSFAGCFTAPSFENFVALISGWILCQGRHCISRVIQVAGGPGGGKHFATLYRFLARARWSVDELGRVLFDALLPMLPEGIDAMVDDTLCRHRGPRIFGSGMHHDAALSTYGRGTRAGRATFFSCGHCWVVLSVRVPMPWDRERGIAIPILFRLYRSKKRCDPTSYRKRTELARELVALLESWLPPGYRLFLSGDAEYASRALVPGLGPATAFLGPMIMDAALYEPAGDYGGMGRPRKKGKRLDSPQQMAGRASRWHRITIRAYGRSIHVLVKERVCLWYTVAGVRLVRVVVTRDPKGRSADRAYFSTDAEMSAEEALERFARRWLIEVSFRDVKQWLGAEDPQNGWSRGKRRGRKKPGPQARGERGKLAVTHTTPLAFTTYAVVVLWYMREGEAERDVRRCLMRAPWYRHKSTPAFGDMLVALRREAWATRLSVHPAIGRDPAKLRQVLPDALLAA